MALQLFGPALKPVTTKPNMRSWAASASSDSFERGRLCFLRLSDERSLPKALRLYRSAAMVLVLAAAATAVVVVITNDVVAVVVAVIVRDVCRPEVPQHSVPDVFASLPNIGHSLTAACAHFASWFL